MARSAVNKDEWRKLIVAPIKPSTPHTMQTPFTAIRKKYLTLGFFLRRGEEWRGLPKPLLSVLPD